MSPDIRPYDSSLKESLFEFTGKCFAELGKAFEPEGRHAFYNDIPEYFDLFLCLVDGDTVMGSAAVKRISGDTCELKALYVSEELRGSGYGFSLLDSAATYAREAGYRRMVLDSMSQYADARRLYLRYGFTDTERYNDNPYADVFMELVFASASEKEAQDT